MSGIEYLRIQRNSGIDCMLKEEVDGKPVFVRVQRKNETAFQAAQALKRAARNKGAPWLMVLITTNDLLGTSDPNRLVNDVLFVHSTGCAIQSLIQKI